MVTFFEYQRKTFSDELARLSNLSQLESDNPFVIQRLNLIEQIISLSDSTDSKEYTIYARNLIDYSFFVIAEILNGAKTYDVKSLPILKDFYRSQLFGEFLFYNNEDINQLLDSILDDLVFPGVPINPLPPSSEEVYIYNYNLIKDIQTRHFPSVYDRKIAVFGDRIDELEQLLEIDTSDDTMEFFHKSIELFDALIESNNDASHPTVVSFDRKIDELWGQLLA